MPSLEFVIGVIGALFVGLTTLLSNTKVKALLTSLKGHDAMASDIRQIKADVRTLRTQINGLPCSAAREPSKGHLISLCGVDR